MIVPDTNVVSEPLKATAPPAVIAWLDRQNIETLFLSTIGLAELRYGVGSCARGAAQTRSKGGSGGAHSVPVRAGGAGLRHSGG
jgi:predicted nucleic acid-binding protein